MRDDETGREFCYGCAKAMLYAADDPVTRFTEFNGSDEYARELKARAPLGLLGWPGSPRKEKE